MEGKTPEQIAEGVQAVLRDYNRRLKKRADLETGSRRPTRGGEAIPLAPEIVRASLSVEIAAGMLYWATRSEQLLADRVEHFFG